MDNIDMFMPEQEEIQSMWKEILLNYGIFLLELLTVFGAIALIVLAIVQSKKQSESGSVVSRRLRGWKSAHAGAQPVRNGGPAAAGLLFG